jgi:methanogenic corrinoid protein MtbC1
MVMSQLVPRDAPIDRCGRGVVVACVSGDLHEVGARMVGDFFELAGWDNYFCGANTPHAAIVQTVAERRPDVLALSVSMGSHLHVAQNLIDAVRADPRCTWVRILVGGRPFNVDPSLWRTIGADGSAADAEAAVALAGSWPVSVR